MMRVVGWWAAALAIAAAAMRIWHAVLFRADTGIGGLVVLLAVGWAGVGIASILERRSGDRDGPATPRIWRRAPLEFWPMLAAFSALLLLFHVGFDRASGDGRGYFAQTRSIVLDRDLDFSNDIAAFGARETDADYPIGTALLWSPFFVAAHASVELLGASDERPGGAGFTNPYQRAVGFGTLCYGFLALLMMTAAVRRYFDPGTTTLAIGSVLLATPLVWYLTVGASMPHGVSLFTVSAFLALWLSAREAGGPRTWAGLAVTTIAMLLVRPQNGLFLLVPAGDLVVRWWSGEQVAIPDFRRIARSGFGRVVVALGALATIVLLVVVAGQVQRYAQGQFLFAEFSPLLLLFSPLHGLISTSPVIAVAFVGLALLFRHDRGLATGFALAVVAQVLLNSSTHGWAGGASFGARRFVSCAMPFAFGLAAAVQEGRRRPLVPMALLLGTLAAMNLFLVDEVRSGRVTLSDQVSFKRLMSAIGERVGSPFALPGSILFALRHDVPLGMLDRVPTHRYFNLDLDIGGGMDEPFLTEGWFDGEFGGGRSFRWTTGPEAGLLVRLRDHAYRFTFVAAPFQAPGLPPQVVEVWVQDHLAGTFELRDGFQSYEAEIPVEWIPSMDWTRVRFRFDHSASPRSLGLSDDTRPLAAQFDSIQFQRR